MFFFPNIFILLFIILRKHLRATTNEKTKPEKNGFKEVSQIKYVCRPALINNTDKKSIIISVKN